MSSSTAASAKASQQLPGGAGCVHSKLVAAAGASVCAAFVVNPMDVVKVRMQAQASASQTAAKTMQSTCTKSVPVRASHQSCGWMVPYSCWDNPPAATWHDQSTIRWWQPPGNRQLPASRYSEARGHCLCALSGTGALQLEGSRAPVWDSSKEVWDSARDGPQSSRPAQGPSMTATIRSILEKEGMPGLWRGLHTSLVMCMSSVLLYYPLYDYLLAELNSPGAGSNSTSSSNSMQLGGAAPVLAGAASRAATVVAVSPLEYVRTRQQAVQSGSGLPSSLTAHGGSAATPTGAWTSVLLRQRVGLQTLQGSLQQAGAAGMDQCRTWVRALPQLWTGLGATIARDVPFAAMYWGLAEPIRAQLQPDHPTRAEVLLANFTAGSLAGTVAAAATTPFDVVKTRMQLAPAGSGIGGSTLMELRAVVQEQGVRGLFVGVGPRVLRCAPACAIVIASYEVLKGMLTEAF